MKVDKDPFCKCFFGGSPGENVCEKHPLWSKCLCNSHGVYQCRFHTGTVCEGPHNVGLI
jgi:hypothetical protein